MLRSPSRHFSLGLLTLGGFIGGIFFWGGFNTALEVTNTRDNVFADLKHTIHYSNRSGVRATGPAVTFPTTGLTRSLARCRRRRRSGGRSSAPSTLARNS